VKLALAGIGEGPEDGAGVLVHGLAKVHGDGEYQDQEEQVDAKERMQEFAEVIRPEEVYMHPDKGHDSEDG
jgi:hypothetical protein